VETPLVLKDLTANPAPLGLLGFGLTTILLNMHNAGLFALGSMILAMGIFYGGIAQVIVGIMEWQKGNTFGMTAFCSFGLFWITFVALTVFPSLGIGEKNSAVAMAAFLAVWGVLLIGMTMKTLKMNRLMQFIFGSATLLFFLLAIATLTGNAVVHQIAGIEGVICGASAMYAGVKQL